MNYTRDDLLYSIKVHNRKCPSGYSKLKKPELYSFLTRHNIPKKLNPNNKRKRRQIKGARIGRIKRDLKPSDLKYGKLPSMAEQRRIMTAGKTWAQKTRNYANSNNMTFNQAKKALGYGK